MKDSEKFISKLCKMRQNAAYITPGYCEDDCGENCGTNQD